MFTKIYKQADIAEKEGLVDICGVGYRKALEFLIKDYAIINHPSEKEKIENKLLGACIKDYISDVNINSVAKRAAWLGNDETHYRRIWQGKTLTDLKNLIKLTMHWMEMEKLTREYESDMPN
jgi:hypothetical protein